MFQFIRELNMIYSDQMPGTESIGGRLNLNDLPVYKSFEFVDNSRELKEFIQKHGVKTKTNRNQGNRVLRNRKGSDGFRYSDDSSNGTQYSKSSISDSEGSKGRKKVYLKRDLHDYDSPEMVAFLDDTTYDIFKDILTETDSLCQDEHFTENYELDHYNFSSAVDSDSESSDSTKETLERLSCIANELNFPEEDECKNERQNPKRFLTEEEEDDFYEGDDRPAKKTVHAIHPSEEVKVDDCQNEQRDYKRLTMEDEEDFQGRRAIAVDDSVKNIVRAIQLMQGVQMEEEGALSNRNCEQVLETESMCSCPESLRISSDGESLASSIEGQIEHSGGDISLPSTNSTASTHSFAFPILTKELPGSPVKMKHGRQALWPASAARQRQMHRPPRWKALFCCKSIMN